MTKQKGNGKFKRDGKRKLADMSLPPELRRRVKRKKKSRRKSAQMDHGTNPKANRLRKDYKDDRKPNDTN